MSATACLTAAQLKVGLTHETTISFSHAQVEQYCELVGDMNAIHHDVEAAKLRFPNVRDIIVPGGLLQASITGIFGTSFPGDGSLGRTFKPERMRIPLCPGDTVTVKLEVTRLRGEMAEFSIRISDASGNAVSSAISRVIVPNDTYQQWWQARNADRSATG